MATLFTDDVLDTSSRVCDVCLDPVPLWDGHAALCRSSCPAFLCSDCVETYFTQCLSDHVPGLLKKVGCPVCLDPMPVHKYALYVSPALLEYAEKCLFAASELRCPDCDNSTPFIEAESPALPPLVLPASLRQKLPWLRRLGTKYVRYKRSAASVYDYIRAAFPAPYTHLVYEHTLKLVRDPERRATLVMYHLHKTRHVYTPCCGRQVCFECKTAGHHDYCDVASAMCYNIVVLCPECSIPLVRGDGCDSIKCVCDTYFSWHEQVLVADERSRHERLKLVLALPRGRAALLLVVEHCRRLVWRRRFAAAVVYELHVRRFRLVVWPRMRPFLAEKVRRRHFQRTLVELEQTVRRHRLCREISARVRRIEAADVAPACEEVRAASPVMDRPTPVVVAPLPDKALDDHVPKDRLDDVTTERTFDMAAMA